MKSTTRKRRLRTTYWWAAMIVIAVLLSIATMGCARRGVWSGPDFNENRENDLSAEETVKNLDTAITREQWNIKRYQKGSEEYTAKTQVCELKIKQLQRAKQKALRLLAIENRRKDAQSRSAR